MILWPALQSDFEMTRYICVPSITFLWQTVLKQVDIRSAKFLLELSGYDVICSSCGSRKSCEFLSDSVTQNER